MHAKKLIVLIDNEGDKLVFQYCRRANDIYVSKKATLFYSFEIILITFLIKQILFHATRILFRRISTFSKFLTRLCVTS